jgi:hypothetical protein
MAGFWHGYDCLEDVEKLEDKPDLSHRLEGIPKARAFGDFLRDFEDENFERMNQLLTKQALAARRQFAPNSPLILDMDSTSHIQSGKKIEGLAVNYKGEISLESLDSFDELGFCYGFRLRDGATFSSVGAGKEISRIFSHLKHTDEKHFRADSAYCNEEVIRACISSGAKFTITAHGNTGWESKVGAITNWKPWEYTENELKRAQDRKVKLTEVELGSMLYQPSWSENLRFYIVVKRTRIEQTSLFS